MLFLEKRHAEANLSADGLGSPVPAVEYVRLAPSYPVTGRIVVPVLGVAGE